MFSHGSNDSRGVLIAFCEGLHFTVEKETKDSKGRILMLKLLSKTHTLEDVSSMLDQIDFVSECKLIFFLGGGEILTFILI